MPVHLQVSPEEYLSTDYGKPDREYVRGEVMERSIPDYWHGRIQGYMVPTVEVRLRMGDELIRILDLTVFAGGHPKERFPSTPPLLVAEVVSEDDRHADLMEKLEEYRRWGVPHIWVVGPRGRYLAVYDDCGLAHVAALTLPEHGVSITTEELFDVS